MQRANSDEAAPHGPAWLRELLQSRRFTNFIIAVILVNAVTLGLETSAAASASFGGLLELVDGVCLAIFTLEVLAKCYVWRFAFFRSGWNVFDFVIVAISLVPAAGPLSVLRALRILRVLRLLSVVPEMRRVVNSLLMALPGMGSIAGVMVLIFYVSAVLATKLFGATHGALFGSIPASMFTLFQIMTLEGWSDGVVRPVMEVHPWAWLFFIPFILITTFAVVNLVIAVIVNSMQTLNDADKADERLMERQAIEAEKEALAGQIAALRNDVAELKALLTRAA
ncbi:MAG: ion transporter [Beijerinckiaceae bacterium]|nr:ion transporter [Beijerinckiaceae bacterium]